LNVLNWEFIRYGQYKVNSVQVIDLREIYLTVYIIFTELETKIDIFKRSDEI